ncbi:MAG: glycoside-pentoside-hexuronide (GPH):cation symporter [Gammaproteobacteria bacterium]|nr:glycoside-pentoside-hexuronide (GPH):cation symporter [Gammaproteobacteria bacterium]
MSTAGESAGAARGPVNTLSVGSVVAYAFPTVGVSLIAYLLNLYFFKYATDVLLIAPAAMGLIFGDARIWDAVSDPMAGFLSDRTESRLGRRRPWLYASALPMAVVPLLLWNPPALLDGLMLIAWTTVAILLYETAITVWFVPHSALGAELSMAHHERTRVFAYRQFAWYLGFLLCVGALHLLTTSEDRRATALLISLVAGGGAGLLILLGTGRVRERLEHVGRGARNPIKAVKDVLVNRYARLLILVFLIENIGTASLGILAPYFMQYIMHEESAYSLLLLSHFIPTILIIPAAVWLSRRFGKKTVWFIAMLFSAGAYVGKFFAGPGELVYLLTVTMATGIGTGIGTVVGPSVQADVVDFDEYETGERKEGSYFAIWNFIRKGAAGLVAALTGILLQWAGFEPNVAQSEGTLMTIRVLYTVLPAVMLSLGALVFLFRFDLTEAAHARVRARLDAREAAASG